MHLISKYWIACTLTLGISCSYGNVVRAQSMSRDSSSPPTISHTQIYKMNYWVSGGIDLVAATGGLLSIAARAKPNFDSAELANINPNIVPSFDRWSLHQNPALVPTFETYSEILQIGMGAIPLALLFDSSIRQDWLEIMMMGLEVNAAAILIYTVSPLGPLFQTRYRPIVYYPTPQYPNNYNKAIYTNNPVNIADGQNKNSFYSGHVASAAAASFFMAKVYCDYHPEASQWLAFGTAAIPPLIMGYVRLMALDHFPSDVAVGYAVGTLCGVLIPELHKIGDNNLSMGIYTSPTTGTGLSLRWVLPETGLN
jgi:membrane-associated phospholipid phosphatase